MIGWPSQQLMGLSVTDHDRLVVTTADGTVNLDKARLQEAYEGAITWQRS